MSFMTDVQEQLRRAAEDLPGSSATVDQLLRSRERRTNRKRIGSGALGIVITLVLVGGLLSLRLDDGAGRQDSQLLQPAAGTLLQPGAGQRQEREIRIYVLNDSGTSVTESRNTYSWDQDGNGIFQSADRMAFFDPARKTAYEAHHGVDTGWQTPEPGTDGGQPLKGGTYEDLDSLPTDPVELKQWIMDGNAPAGGWQAPAVDGEPDSRLGSTDAGVWHLLFWDILQCGPGSSAVRSAAAQAMSGVENVDIDRTAVDPAGRPAIKLHLVYQLDALGWGSAGESAEEWIYADPTTLAPLALVEFGGSEIIIVASDQIVSADSGDVVQGLVPALDDDRLPFPDPGRSN
jgi:hypothetical protein